MGGGLDLGDSNTGKGSGNPREGVRNIRFRRYMSTPAREVKNRSCIPHKGDGACDVLRDEAPFTAAPIAELLPTYIATVEFRRLYRSENTVANAVNNSRPGITVVSG